MNCVKVDELNIIRQIFDGDISFTDKKLVNPRCDKLYGEIESFLSERSDKELIELARKYSELISLLEIERFAQGAKFMQNFLSEVDKVKIL